MNTEPVGTKKPSFSTDLKSMGYERYLGQNFALLCPAQAMPIPSYRLV